MSPYRPRASRLHPSAAPWRFDHRASTRDALEALGVRAPTFRGQLIGRQATAGGSLAGPVAVERVGRCEVESTRAALAAVAGQFRLHGVLIAQARR